VVAATAPTTLFWTESAQGTVSTCTPSMACTDYKQIVTGQNDPDQLVVDSAHVYFTSSGTMPMNYEDGAVVQANLDGSSVVTLASHQPFPRGIVVDSSYIYWVNYVSGTATTGTVNRVPIGGGTTVTLATGQASPLGLAEDAMALYWGDQGSGNIVRLAK
jgi:hypothetical protein